MNIISMLNLRRNYWDLISINIVVLLIIHTSSSGWKGRKAKWTGGVQSGLVGCKADLFGVKWTGAVQTDLCGAKWTCAV